VVSLLVSLYVNALTEQAEELESHLHIEPKLNLGARICGDFQYDANLPSEKPDDTEGDDEKKTKSDRQKSSTASDEKAATPGAPDSGNGLESEPFALRGMDISIPRGRRSPPHIEY
jgi:hypothetical protein